jgi:hypothetical protein
MELQHRKLVAQETGENQTTNEYRKKPAWMDNSYFRQNPENEKFKSPEIHHISCATVLFTIFFSVIAYYFGAGFEIRILCNVFCCCFQVFF